MQKEYDLSLPAQGKKNLLSPAKLLSAETLLRLNPHWIVEELVEENGTFTAALKDHETEKSFQLLGTLTSPDAQTLEATLEQGDYKKVKLFRRGAGFWAEVVYRSEEEPDEAVERHVVLWIRSIKEYLRMYLNNSLNTVFFRYLMNKIILKMTPSQRKISLMLIRITVVEVFVILLIVVGYVIFVLKPLGSP
ncbi:MAG: hypothetical protein WBB19_06445 [Desulforhopalus sp.]